MVSKIIQKEKERQDDYLNGENNWVYSENQLDAEIKSHKQSLINLKEYIEELVPKIYDKECAIESEYSMGDSDPNFKEDSDQLKEDMEELTKMIEAYK